MGVATGRSVAGPFAQTLEAGPDTGAASAPETAGERVLAVRWR